MPQTQSGVNIPFDMGPGVGDDDMLTLSNSYADFSDNMVNANPLSVGQPMATPKVSAVWYLFGLILILIAFKFAVEHEGSTEMSFMGISVYNFLAVTLMVIPGIALFKIAVNKYYVPGLTDLVNTV